MAYGNGGKRRKNSDRYGSDPRRGDRGRPDSGVESMRRRLAELKRLIESQDLPVRTRFKELKSLITESAKRKGISLLEGETGSGKSVYSPVAMREALQELGLPDKIVMMQPRKDAATGIANAVAAVSEEDLGRGVGYSTSERKGFSGDTHTSVVTSGVMLQYLASGRIDKEKVGAVIIDELHEASIDYHVVLGLLKMLHEEDNAPLILLTTATLDKKKYQDYYGIDDEDHEKIEGRTYPVEKEFVDQNELSHEGREIPYTKLAAQKAGGAVVETKGDVLVFMPGRREIMDTIGHLEDLILQRGQKFEDIGLEVLPLYGGLPEDDRQDVIRGKKPAGIQRRIIVCTNIAETSLTVPGITAVVDSCRERSVKFNPDTGITEMGTGFISKDQAEQRAGRAGRVQEGHCYRLIPEKRFEALKQHPDSEIHQSNLSQVVLRLKSYGLDPKTFPFIDAPDPNAVRQGIKELQILGALDEKEALTDVGMEMKDLGFEPRIARMIVEGKKRGCIDATIALAAFNQFGNVFMGPSRKDVDEAFGFDNREKRASARARVKEIQSKFNLGDSDWLRNISVLVKAVDEGLFTAVHRNGNEGRAANKKLEKWCRANYINAKTLKNIARRLKDFAKYAGVKIDLDTYQDTLMSTGADDLGAVILSAHADQLMYLVHSGFGLPEYSMVESNGRGYKAIVPSPGSVAFEKKPLFAITSHITEGSGKQRGMEVKRNYAHGIHPVNAEQMIAVMPHILERQSTELKYDPKTDSVYNAVKFRVRGAGENLPGEKKEPIRNVELAVEGFAKALAQGSVDTRVTRINGAMIKRVDQYYARSKGRISSVNFDMAGWYERKLREHGNIHTKAALEERQDDFFLEEGDLIEVEQLEDLNEYYPTTIQMNGVDVEVEYSYKPEYRSVRLYSRTEPEKFEAKIKISAKDIYKVGPAEMPRLGRARDGLIVEVSVVDSPFHVSDRRTIVSLYHEFVRRDTDEKFWDFYKTQEGQPRNIASRQLRPLPTAQEHGLKKKVEIGNRFDGQPIYAYLGIQGWGRHSDNPEFSFRYFRTQEEAEENTNESIATKTRLDTKVAMAKGIDPTIMYEVQGEGRRGGKSMDPTAERLSNMLFSEGIRREDESEDQRTTLLKQLDLALALVQATRETEPAGNHDIRGAKNLAKAKKRVKDVSRRVARIREDHEGIAIDRLRGLVDAVMNDAKRSAREAALVEGNVRTRWYDVYDQIVKAVVPVVEKEWEGELTDDGLKAIQAELIKISKDKTLSADEIRMAAEDLIAEHLS